MKRSQKEPVCEGHWDSLKEVTIKYFWGYSIDFLLILFLLNKNRSGQKT